MMMHKLTTIARAGTTNPTVWSLIKLLQMEQAATEMVVAQIHVGAEPIGR